MNERFERGLRRANEVDQEQVGRIVASLHDIAPDFARYLVEFAFGDIHARPGLDLKARQIATVAALTALGTVPPSSGCISTVLSTSAARTRRSPR